MVVVRVRVLTGPSERGSCARSEVRALSPFDGDDSEDSQGTHEVNLTI